MSEIEKDFYKKAKYYAILAEVDFKNDWEDLFVREFSLSLFYYAAAGVS